MSESEREGGRERNNNKHFQEKLQQPMSLPMHGSALPNKVIVSCSNTYGLGCHYATRHASKCGVH